MFKRILIPTDGSTIADKAVKAGIRFAREIGARVVGYYAIEPLQAYYYSEGAMVDGRLIAELDRQSKAAGEKALAAMAKLAKGGRVRFDSLCDKPRTARRHHRCGAQEEVRCGLHGVPWAHRAREAGGGQRHSKGARPVEDSGGGLPLRPDRKSTTGIPRRQTRTAGQTAPVARPRMYSQPKRRLCSRHAR